MNEDNAARGGTRNKKGRHADDLDHLMRNLRARVHARHPEAAHVEDDLAEIASARIEAVGTNAKEMFGSAARPSLAIEEVFQRVRELANAKADPIGGSSGQNLAAYDVPLRLAEQLTVSSPSPLEIPNFSR